MQIAQSESTPLLFYEFQIKRNMVEEAVEININIWNKTNFSTNMNLIKTNNGKQ